MKDIQFKCISEGEFAIKDKVLTSKHWKEFFLSCSLKPEARMNIESLSGKDVIDYVSHVFKLKFEKVEKYIF